MALLLYTFNVENVTAACALIVTGVGIDPNALVALYAITSVIGAQLLLT